MSTPALPASGLPDVVQELRGRIHRGELGPGGAGLAFEFNPLLSHDEYHALVALAERHVTNPTEAARRIILERLAAEHLPRDVAGVGRGQPG